MQEAEIKPKDKLVAPYIYERQGKKGASYLVRIRESGIKETKTCKTLDEAKAYVHEVKYKINRGEAVDSAKRKKTLLKDIFASYLEHNTVSKGKEYSLKKLMVELSNVELGKFKAGTFAEYLKFKLNQEIPDQVKKKKEHPLFDGYMVEKNGVKVRRTYSESSVRKIYYNIKTALEWHAKHNDYPFNSEVFDKNDAPRAWVKSRDRVLEDGELERLIQACDRMYKNKKELKALLTFQHYSCMRMGEALLMKWSDIRLNEEQPFRSYIFVPKENQKTSDKESAFDRKIPLRPEFYNFVKDELLQIKKLNQTLVFGHYWKDSDALVKPMRTLCKNGKVEKFRWHDFRHHSISYFFRPDPKTGKAPSLSIIDVSRITGHIDVQTLNRYVVISHEDIGAKLWA